MKAKEWGFKLLKMLSLHVSFYEEIIVFPCNCF